MYDTIHAIVGRNVTPEERDAFKASIRGYLNSCKEYADYIKANEREPIEHILICGKCNKKEIALGYDERKKKRRTFVSP